MKVYIVFDPLFEEVHTVHKKLETAQKAAKKLDEKDALGEKRERSWHEVEERELEE